MFSSLSFSLGKFWVSVMSPELPAELLKTGGSRHSGQAKRDPESSPAQSGIQTIPDSGFRRNDGMNDICKKLPRLEFGA
jgi:hypothetical protein